MTNITKERVRYAETDAMGITHHATYLLWMELGRTALLREAGLPYSKLEKDGIMLPVAKLGVKYLAPTYYDDEISIHSTNTRMTNVKLRIDYKIFRNDTEPVCLGYTEHAIIDSHTRKIVRAPEFLRQAVVIPPDAESLVNDI